jgi:hypothetical protein
MSPANLVGLWELLIHAIASRNYFRPTLYQLRRGIAVLKNFVASAIILVMLPMAFADEGFEKVKRAWQAIDSDWDAGTANRFEAEFKTVGGKSSFIRFFESKGVGRLVEVTQLPAKRASEFGAELASVKRYIENTSEKINFSVTRPAGSLTYVLKEGSVSDAEEGVSPALIEAYVANFRSGNRPFGLPIETLEQFCTVSLLQLNDGKWDISFLFTGEFGTFKVGDQIIVSVDPARNCRIMNGTRKSVDEGVGFSCYYDDSGRINRLLCSFPNSASQEFNFGELPVDFISNDEFTLGFYGISGVVFEKKGSSRLIYLMVAVITISCIIGHFYFHRRNQ